MIHSRYVDYIFPAHNDIISLCVKHNNIMTRLIEIFWMQIVNIYGYQNMLFYLYDRIGLLLSTTSFLYQL